MAHFLKYFLLMLISSAVVLEVLLRMLSLAGHTMPEQSVRGDRLFKPNATGVYVRGGLREISSYYQINPQGWNSVRDYEKDFELKDRGAIAIIGDSFIEGLATDVRFSIGRLMENELKDQFFVHEFGRSGGNLSDYLRLYCKYDLQRYDYVFIRLSTNDLNRGHPAFMDQGHNIPRESALRSIYNSSALIRYLNINHGFSEKLKKLIGKKRKPKSSIANHDMIGRFSKSITNTFERNVHFFYEPLSLDTLVVGRLGLPMIRVKHILQPINFGFDTHWNINGRTNVARSLAEYIKDKENWSNEGSPAVLVDRKRGMDVIKK